MKSSPLFDIVAAGALGDAFGYAIEFDSWSKIQSRHGPAGLLNWPLDASGRMAASDDTQMTLFAMEGLRQALANAPADPTAFADRVEAAASAAFLRWLGTQSANGPGAGGGGLAARREMFKRQAPGNTCLSALASIRDGRKAVNQSKGCGAVMRAAPYAFLAGSFGMSAVWDCAARQGALTHLHVDGWASGAALAWIIARAPRDLDALARAALEAADRAELEGASATAAKTRQAVDLRHEALNPQILCDVIGEGWVGEEALGVALWAALRTSSATDAIRLGANHRGDSDSTASIAGQLSACVWGLSPTERSALSLVDLGPAVEHEVAALDEALDEALDRVGAAPKSPSEPS
jgi:ADP-ribosyl-[dinitrogen reductase] hydrolase